MWLDLSSAFWGTSTTSATPTPTSPLPSCTSHSRGEHTYVHGRSSPVTPVDGPLGLFAPDGPVGTVNGNLELPATCATVDDPGLPLDLYGMIIPPWTVWGIYFGRTSYCMTVPFANYECLICMCIRNHQWCLWYVSLTIGSARSNGAVSKSFQF